MQYCEKHDLVIDPLHESCPLCEAEEKSDEIAALRMENAQAYTMMECMGEELDRMKLIIARLRGIEKAVTIAQSGADMDSYTWRLFAMALNKSWRGWIHTANAIADAL